MASHPPRKCCTLGALHEGEPRGKLVRVGERRIEAYLAIAPQSEGHKDVGLLLIPDVFGISLNSKLLADMFADEGFTTLIPDFFNGDALPNPRPAGLDIKAWIKTGSSGDNPHTPETVDPIVVAGLEALKGLGIKEIGGGIKVGFVAHPSFVEEDELAAINGPLAISAAQTDPIFPPEKRRISEEILIKTKQPYQINIYSGVEHGFAIRGNPKVKLQRYAREQAFKQAVHWFEEFLV
ncbi:unnamed protein product [Clonostachys chloroleuca]|uniref:Dienelactone hydrolase domain-containing protein n=1 Tax=Clonostachys chloroleuca TaxID=1926264 RepID=A0AA35M748_9HYPO|nr:unnamed protein product [Clonostachys chloroleuca]